MAPDSFTRAFIASVSTSNLTEIHNGLGHPGVTRMLHFIRSKNMPFSTEDVKKTCFTCRICAELKPQFYRPTPRTLIKATQPMELRDVNPMYTNVRYMDDRSSQHQQTQPRMGDSSAFSDAHPVAHLCPHG